MSDHPEHITNVHYRIPIPDDPNSYVRAYAEIMQDPISFYEDLAKLNVLIKLEDEAGEVQYLLSAVGWGMLIALYCGLETALASRDDNDPRYGFLLNNTQVLVSLWRDEAVREDLHSGLLNYSDLVVHEHPEE